LSLGYCGQLCSPPKYGTVFVVPEALAGDGCSAYYSGGRNIIKASETLCRKICDGLEKAGFRASRVAVFTTDAFFRETPGLIDKALEQGCSAVDMESSALMAASAARGVEFLPVLLPFDSLKGGKWKRIPPPSALMLRNLLKPVADIMDMD
jgi:uridine phosphorylase